MTPEQKAEGLEAAYKKHKDRIAGEFSDGKWPQWSGYTLVGLINAIDAEARKAAEEEIAMATRKPRWE